MRVLQNSSSLKSFYFLRHGETDWNRDRLYMGCKDIPLNTQGISQAHSAAEHLSEVNAIKFIYASPLQRAYETAKIVAQTINFDSEIIIIDDLKECNWGVYEQTKVVEDGRSLFNNWVGGKEIPGGETIDQFRTRVVRGFEKCMSESDDVFLIVAHSGVYYILQEYLNIDLFRPKNCHPIFHEYDGKKNTWAFQDKGIKK